MNPSLLSRLAAKKAGNYLSPFAPNYSSRWGGETFPIGQNVGYRSTFGRWHESPKTPFRFVGLASDLIRLSHTGWHTQHGEYDETARGVVYLLPHGKYLAGVADPYQSNKDGSGPAIIEVNAQGMPFVYDDEKEAARAADDLAERYAESSREDDRLDQERQRLESKIEEAEEELEDTRRDARSLLSEIRDSRLSPALCERLKREFRAMRQTMRESLQTLRDAKRELSELPA